MDIISRILNSFIFWSAWMIIPFVMEIIPALGSVFVLFTKKKKTRKNETPLLYPDISIIIPVYNSSDTLEACIQSIYDSDYPNNKIRVFLVNNKTKDNSFQIFSACQEKFPELVMQWLNAEQGKSKALNLALYNSNGKYIIHIDSDGILEPSALRHMVERFENDLTTNCMTGAICTNPTIIETYPHGFSRLFRKMEFMEYAQAFLAGRNYASERNAVYTLSGAFSAFRKSAILQSRLYNTDTICEDTQITFQMKYLQNESIKICENAIFFVDPIENVNKLYTQRQRWQRGSLEVTKMFMNYGFSPLRILTDVTVRTIMYDHTFAFPRLVWYLALICLLFMGYSAKIIGISTMAIMFMYAICGFLYFLAVCGFLADFKELKSYYVKQWWVVFLLPAFNLFVFFIRMAGIINSIESDSAWKTRTFTEEKNAFSAEIKKDFGGLIKVVKKVRGLVNDEPGTIHLSKGVFWHICFNLLYALSVLLLVLVHYVKTEFGIGFNELMGVLRSPLNGTGTGMITNTIAYTLPRFVPLIVPVIILSVYSCRGLKKQEKNKETMPKKKFSFVEHAIACISVLACLFFLGYAERTFSIIDTVTSSAGVTYVYDNYYVSPDTVAITAPDRKKNLIYIYVESLETTYASKSDGGVQLGNYIPNLTALAKDNISFSDKNGLLGGFHSPYGSTYTMAALFAMTTGVPYTMHLNESVGNGVEYMAPGIITLGDILKKQGYVQEFLCGSNAAFGGREQYFVQHGDYEIFDLFTAREQGYIADDYFVWWGFEDKILFEIAKNEVLRLSQENEPFNLTMLTVDLHSTDGYICDYCEDNYAEVTANVSFCTDRQVSEFVAWCQTQEFYEDTVIVITGDHPRMDISLVAGVDYFDRTVYNCFINTELEVSEIKTDSRICSALDIFPTTLAAMGFQMEGNRLGLGTNLFSSEPTMSEQFGFEWLDVEFQKHSDYYLKEFLKEN